MIALDPQQKLGVDLLCESPIGIVTGHPGTGKTTIILQAIQQLEARGLSYALCAPTGKAARRMSEATGREAKTIHRLLGWHWDGFDYCRGNPLPFDVLIVDESSMIDTQLAGWLFEAVDPRHTRVLLVGDANQLPPVGPGAPFRDLIDCGRVPVAWLNTLHRAAKKSWVCRNSPRILAGGKDLELEDCEDFEFHELDNTQAWYIPEAIADIIRKLKAEKVTAEEIQVLTPMRKREAGSVAINQFLQQEFNPTGPSLTIGGGEHKRTFREGDRVMQTRNDYGLEVFNGEVGYIHTITKQPPGMRLEFDTGSRIYTQDKIRRLELAYAMTIHKSQGSEWPFVIVVCHSTHRFMLSRQLLYTAVTRAREAVFLVGDTAGVKHALRTIKDSQRRTLLPERLGSRND